MKIDPLGSGGNFQANIFSLERSVALLVSVQISLDMKWIEHARSKTMVTKDI